MTPLGSQRSYTGTSTSDYRYTDQELDAENGLYNYNARLYDPFIGRFISPDTVVQAPYNPQSLNRYSYCLNNPLIYVDPSGHFWGLGEFWDSLKGLLGQTWQEITDAFTKIGSWSRENLPGIIGAPIGGICDTIGGIGTVIGGVTTGNGNMISNGLKAVGHGVLSTVGLKEAVTELPWVDGDTGGKLPESLKNGMSAIGDRARNTESWKNGMHSWHAATNAFIANRTGVLGSVFQVLGGIYHETPFDSGSFKVEQRDQGTVNHFLDSVTDICANTFGMLTGYLLPSEMALNVAYNLGNYIPGPGDPDPNMGGGGTHRYKGDPRDAWGQYPGDKN